MKKFCYLAGWLLLAVSCNQDFDENTILPAGADQTREQAISAYAVPVDKALESLFVALEQIDGADETRSGVMRYPVSVVGVKAAELGEFTRAELSDADDLLYVVSFGEGAGSAVLGADRRVSPILAILDETVLTAEDFRYDVTRSDDVAVDAEENIQTYLTDLIAEAAVRQAGTASLSVGPVEMLQGVWEERISQQSIQAPRLKTKWHQNSPFNDAAPMDGTSRSLAGCGPIAYAQFLYNMRWPNPNVIGGKTFDWDLLSELEYGKTPSAAARAEVASYVYTIGVCAGAEFSATGTTTYLSSLVSILSSCGISSSKVAFNVDTAKSIVCNKGPLCMRGSSSSGIGHAWVVDGWNSYLTQTWLMLYNKYGRFVRESLESETWTKLLHCNFGWNGTCDGYYSYEVVKFDMSTSLDERYVDEEIGDVRGSNNSCYDRSFYMVSY